jgi:hypothetical protein
MESKLSHIADRVNMKHKTYLKKQSLVPSNLQKKAKASDTHIDKRSSVITTFPICKEKRQNLKYEKSATKLNPDGLDFPDNFMAVMGWRRVKP